MRLERPSFGWGRRAALSALLALLLLFVSALSVSPSLHHLLHHDSNDRDHNCLVTLFAKGQMNASEALPLLIAFVAALFFLLPPLQSAVFSSFDYRFSASRAPPRL